MRPSWFKISAILAGLWLVVGSITYWLGARLPSPEKVEAFAKANPVAGKPDAARSLLVKSVAKEYLHLNFEQSYQLLQSEGIKQWWAALTVPERKDFRFSIFPRMRQVAAYFDRLNPTARTENINKMVKAAKSRGGEENQFSESAIFKVMTVTIAQQGLSSFIESPALDQTFETLLLFHEIERRFVWSRER